MSVCTLELHDLRTYFETRNGTVKAVDGVSLRLDRGEILGLVGESGSGKSVTGFSILGLVDPPGRVVDGEILFKGQDLRRLPDDQLQKLRGSKISMIFQDPMMTLNPVLRIDTQMVETVRAHAPGVSRDAAREKALDALRTVGLPDPEARMRTYPHQLSGGMRQRVAIAIAFVNDPELVIADEPTTALDVTIQAQILFEATKLCAERGTSMIWISHDLAVVSGLADRIAVMYAGRIVELGSATAITQNPAHPYTVGLLGSVPSANKRGARLTQIPGLAPNMLNPPPDCAFRPRCSRAGDRCGKAPDTTVTGEGQLRCHYPVAEALA